jgi:hypothetical protein
MKTQSEWINSTLQTGLDCSADGGAVVAGQLAVKFGALSSSLSGFWRGTRRCHAGGFTVLSLELQSAGDGTRAELYVARDTGVMVLKAGTKLTGSGVVHSGADALPALTSLSWQGPSHACLHKSTEDEKMIVAVFGFFFFFF